jgi:hypothetical protein
MNMGRKMANKPGKSANKATKKSASKKAAPKKSAAKKAAVRKTAAKKKAAKKTAAKKVVRLEMPLAARFDAMVAGSITRDEIYHRLEWYFDQRHDPRRGHGIDPNSPIDGFFQGMDGATGRQVLWVNLNRISATFSPAWQSALFHGIQFPWTSKPPTAIGLRDIQTFGNLIDSAVLTYRHFGWNVQ